MDPSIFSLALSCPFISMVVILEVSAVELVGSIIIAGVVQ